ncbi:hypothetical protein JKP88DRAFT_348674 [Tribonema minus]|uniref:Uncharacterized protein n=1 Tax=Tribonema minus TaxID=303371 RepID=A0A835YWA9_9STRA|nr:hypothetical protein JKP88DRAFT_348674 [Tribonema minus]
MAALVESGTVPKSSGIKPQFTSLVTLSPKPTVDEEFPARVNITNIRVQLGVQYNDVDPTFRAEVNTRGLKCEFCTGNETFTTDAFKPDEEEVSGEGGLSFMLAAASVLTVKITIAGGEQEEVFGFAALPLGGMGDGDFAERSAEVKELSDGGMAGQVLGFISLTFQVKLTYQLTLQKLENDYDAAALPKLLSTLSAAAEARGGAALRVSALQSHLQSLQTSLAELEAGGAVGPLLSRQLAALVAQSSTAHAADAAEDLLADAAALAAAAPQSAAAAAAAAAFAPPLTAFPPKAEADGIYESLATTGDMFDAEKPYSFALHLDLQDPFVLAADTEADWVRWTAALRIACDANAEPDAARRGALPRVPDYCRDASHPDRPTAGWLKRRKASKKTFSGDYVRRFFRLEPAAEGGAYALYYAHEPTDDVRTMTRVAIAEGTRLVTPQMLPAPTPFAVAVAIRAVNGPPALTVGVVVKCPLHIAVTPFAVAVAIRAVNGPPALTAPFAVAGAIRAVNGPAARAHRRERRRGGSARRPARVNVAAAAALGDQRVRTRRGDAAAPLAVPVQPNFLAYAAETVTAVNVGWSGEEVGILPREEDVALPRVVLTLGEPGAEPLARAAVPFDQLPFGKTLDLDLPMDGPAANGGDIAISITLKRLGQFKTVWPARKTRIITTSNPHETEADKWEGHCMVRAAPHGLEVFQVGPPDGTTVFQVGPPDGTTPNLDDKEPVMLVDYQSIEALTAVNDSTLDIAVIIEPSPSLAGPDSVGPAGSERMPRGSAGGGDRGSRKNSLPRRNSFGMITLKNSLPRRNSFGMITLKDSLPRRNSFGRITLKKKEPCAVGARALLASERRSCGRMRRLAYPAYRNEARSVLALGKSVSPTKPPSGAAADARPPSAPQQDYFVLRVCPCPAFALRALANERQRTARDRGMLAYVATRAAAREGDLQTLEKMAAAASDTYRSLRAEKMAAAASDTYRSLRASVADILAEAAAWPEKKAKRGGLTREQLRLTLRAQRLTCYLAKLMEVKCRPAWALDGAAAAAAGGGKGGGVDPRPFSRRELDGIFAQQYLQQTDPSGIENTVKATGRALRCLQERLDEVHLYLYDDDAALTKTATALFTEYYLRSMGELGAHLLSDGVLEQVPIETVVAFVCFLVKRDMAFSEALDDHSLKPSKAVAISSILSTETMLRRLTRRVMLEVVAAWPQEGEIEGDAGPYVAGLLGDCAADSSGKLSTRAPEDLMKLMEKYLPLITTQCQGRGELGMQVVLAMLAALPSYASNASLDLDSFTHSLTHSITFDCHGREGARVVQAMLAALASYASNAARTVMSLNHAPCAWNCVRYLSAITNDMSRSTTLSDMFLTKYAEDLVGVPVDALAIRHGIKSGGVEAAFLLADVALKQVDEVCTGFFKPEWYSEKENATMRKTCKLLCCKVEELEGMVSSEPFFPVIVEAGVAKIAFRYLHAFLRRATDQSNGRLVTAEEIEKMAGAWTVFTGRYGRDVDTMEQYLRKYGPTVLSSVYRLKELLSLMTEKPETIEDAVFGELLEGHEGQEDSVYRLVKVCAAARADLRNFYVPAWLNKLRQQMTTHLEGREARAPAVAFDIFAWGFAAKVVQPEDAYIYKYLMTCLTAP